MGWCSGTEIFDKVAKHVLTSGELSEDAKYNIVETLIEALQDHDWDCEQDSQYFGNPIVQHAMRNLNPDWDWDEIESERD